MEYKRPLGVTIFGWFFITLSLLVLVWAPKYLISYNKSIAMLKDVTEFNSLIPNLPITAIISILISFIFIFVTGIGILKLKSWAYYMALFIPFALLSNILWEMWFYGPQYKNPGQLTVSILFCIVILTLFLRKKYIDLFNFGIVKLKKFNLTPKIFIGLLISLFVLRFLMIPIWYLYANIKYKESLHIINLQPQKREYKVEDKEFISNSCQKRNLLDCSVYIPKDWKISTISIDESGSGWNLAFINKQDSSLKAFIILDNKSSSILAPISKALRFRDVYDFERMLYYPTRRPIYLVLKTIETQNGLEKIDEASSLTWKGFIKIYKKKDQKRNIYDAFLYSLKDKKAYSFGLCFENSVITSLQARSIIASFNFEKPVKSSKILFNEAKMALVNNDYTNGTLGFMNAFYQDRQNPEYAYWLAYALYGDPGEMGKKSRLFSSKRFLEYCLKLKPNYQEAKDLLTSVNSEIQKIEKEKRN